MTDPLIAKLERLGPLLEEERAELRALGEDATTVAAGFELAHDGDQSSRCTLLLDGMACSFKTINRVRQIVTFNFPGDILDLTSLILGGTDCHISTITPARVASIPHSRLTELLGRPNIARLFWQDTLIDSATFREWVINVARRPTRQRTGHLLCELVTRLRVVGLAAGNPCEIPVSRTVLADALGIPVIRVNRTLHSMHREGLLNVTDEAVMVLDWPGLKNDAMYDAGYLRQLASAAA